MPDTPTITNPAEQLAATVSQLYDLAGNSKTTVDQRQALLLQAHDLRGDLVGLVAIQFTNASAAYKKAMKDLGTVTSALNDAKQDVAKTIAVINGAAQLAKSLDDLLKEAMQVAAGAAKVI